MDLQYLKGKYRVFRKSIIVRKCLQSVYKVIYPMYMHLFWWPTSYCMRIILPSPNKKDWETRILVIKDDGIGDIVMSSGIIKHLKKSFPDKKIYILVNQGLESLLKNCADCVLSFNSVYYFRKIKYRWHFLKKMRNIGFSIVISGVLKRGITDNDILISLGAQETIAYEGEGIELKSLQRLNNKYKTKFSKFILSMDREGGDMNYIPKATDHEIFYYSKALGISVDDVKPSIFSESHLTKEFSYETLSRWNLKKHAYFTIGIGSRNTGRIWPSERFKEIARWTLDSTGLIPVLIGGKGEEGLAFDSFDSLYRHDQVMNLIGKLSLNECLTVLENAAFFIGNESGPMHLSAAFHVPIVALFGGGHFGRCFPYGDQHEIIYHKMDCYCCNWKCKYRNLALYVAPCIEEISIAYVKSRLISFFLKHRNLFTSSDCLSQTQKDKLFQDRLRNLDEK